MSTTRKTTQEDMATNQMASEHATGGEAKFSFGNDKSGMDTANFRCLRTPEDGSMYYGEVAFVKAGQDGLIRTKSQEYETDIKALTKE
jgi:hypothetical protein